MNNIGRNDPCPCGSGKKYKKCCLARDEAARFRDQAARFRETAARPQAATIDGEKPFIAELRPDLDKKVDRLLQRLEQGEGRAVEPEIKALLEKHPHYHMTHYAMGLYIGMVLDDPLASIPYFERAVEILPIFPEAHFNLGAAAMKAGDANKAVRAYRAAARYSRGDDGIAEMAQKELRFLEKALLEHSSFPTMDAYLANAKLFDEAYVRLANQDFETAAEMFNRVLSENPTHVQSFGNLALAYAGLGRRADAMECFDRALALDPKYEPAIGNRRVIAQMREGEPFVPDGIKETYYYLEKLKREKQEK
jgi:tetratricopeptide (TPR) repeat protein